MSTQQPILERSATQLWARNPGEYMRELAQTQLRRTTWDEGYLRRRSRMKPLRAYMDLHLGKGSEWETLYITQTEAVHEVSGQLEPVGVYPVYKAHWKWEQLLHLIRHPWSKNWDRMMNENLPADRRPKQRQAHVIVITELPNIKTPEGALFYTELAEIQQDHPEVTLLLHGSYSFRCMFGFGYAAADWDPRQHAKGGYIMLPSGYRQLPDMLKKQQYWINLLGYNFRELTLDPKVRCVFNIHSACWAARYFTSTEKFIGGDKKKWDSPKLEGAIRANSRTFTHTLAKREGDRLLCSDCSLWLSCKLYREGAVCIVPGSEMRDLAKMFKSRDSSQIVGALSNLVAANAERAAEAMVDESQDDERSLDPELTKLMDQVFKQGAQLLQLVDPKYRPGGTKVQVNVGAGGVAVGELPTGGDVSRNMAANAIRQLQARGIPLDQITEEMVQQLLTTEAGRALPVGTTIPGETA